MILTENQCYMKIVPYCRKIFHEVSLPVGWIWPKSSTSCQSLLVWARVSQFTLFFAYFIRTHQFLSALILLNSGRNFTKCVIKCTVSVFSKKSSPEFVVKSPGSIIVLKFCIPSKMCQDFLNAKKLSDKEICKRNSADIFFDLGHRLRCEKIIKST